MNEITVLQELEDWLAAVPPDELPHLADLTGREVARIAHKTPNLEPRRVWLQASYLVMCAAKAQKEDKR